jgi:hypothetical protein
MCPLRRALTPEDMWRADLDDLSRALDTMEASETSERGLKKPRACASLLLLLVRARRACVCSRGLLRTVANRPPPCARPAAAKVKVSKPRAPAGGAAGAPGVPMCLCCRAKHAHAVTAPPAPPPLLPLLLLLLLLA